MDDTIAGVTQYRIIRPIAEGGMGAVDEALQDGVEGFNKTVAIKTIKGRFAADEEFVRLFIGEAKLVADLVHENIVQVYNLGRSEDRYYIVMEFVEGIPLEQFVAHHKNSATPVPVELGAFIISRVCRGLEYAHCKAGRDGSALGIVHRDISPKNVLVNFEGVVKVTDFGIAKAREVMEQDEEILMGRIEYMSPEQARREATDRRSDLYSVGVLLYEILSGLPPERGAGSLVRQHGLGTSSPKPIAAVRADVPRDLADIIERALQPDPADRFQTAGEMGFALEYHLYHKGYGPTNVTLGNYLKGRLRQATHAPLAHSDTDITTAHMVTVRAETMFGKALDQDDTKG
jgi:eukaryotic-like serine/threonine-protein kinase